MRLFAVQGKRWVRGALGELNCYRLRAGGVLRIPNMVAILLYHVVSEEEVRDPLQMCIPARLFENQIKALRSWGVQFLPLEDAIRQVWDAGVLDAPIVSVVFDDGYESVFRLAFPQLSRLSVPATVFLSTKYIGLGKRFPWASPDYGAPLSWDQVHEMAEAGVTFGAHGHSHVSLATLPGHRILEEVTRSRDTIEERTGKPVGLFAYPYGYYGSFNELTRRVLAEEGFRGSCTTIWGRNDRRDDPLRLKRIRLSWRDSPREVWKALVGCYDWYEGIQRIQGMLGIHVPRDPEAAFVS